MWSQPLLCDSIAAAVKGRRGSRLPSFFAEGHVASARGFDRNQLLSSACDVVLCFASMGIPSLAEGGCSALSMGNRKKAIAFSVGKHLSRKSNLLQSGQAMAHPFEPIYWKILIFRS
jgi:hypothetical protein